MTRDNISPDDNPVIGPLADIEGLIVVAGSSGHGFKLGPAIGEEVARLITTGNSELLTPFSPARFEGVQAAVGAAQGCGLSLVAETVAKGFRECASSPGRHLTKRQRQRRSQ